MIDIILMSQEQLSEGSVFSREFSIFSYNPQDKFSAGLKFIFSIAV
jgi:hypothetical protein